MALPSLRIVALRAIPHMDMFAQGVPRWIPAGETFEVAGAPHWLDELRAKDPTCAPADAATAKAAGIAFDAPKPADKAAQKVSA